MSDDQFFSLERSEESLILKRKAYLRRRINRVTNLFTDEKRQNVINILVDRLEKLSTRELKYLVVGGALPEIPNDNGDARSITSAAKMTQLDPETIRNFANLIVEEREKEIERELVKKSGKLSLRISIVALFISASIAGNNIYKTFFIKDNKKGEVEGFVIKK
jgi:hypothetical protein